MERCTLKELWTKAKSLAQHTEADLAGVTGTPMVYVLEDQSHFSRVKANDMHRDGMVH